MIKFFKKIRFKLMDTEKTGRYFKYAIGEIILVVIGILIALAINNQNENRKNSQKKENLLNALKIEFTSNLSQLDTVIFYDNMVLNNSQKLLKLNTERPIEIMNDSMPYWLQYASFRWTFNPINGALRSGISSGEIHLIKSDSLINLLFGWEDFVNDAREDEQRCVQAVIASKSIIEKHVRNLDYRSVYIHELGKSKNSSDYLALLQDPLFEDYLGERYLSMADAMTALNEVRKQNILIIELIKTELSIK